MHRGSSLTRAGAIVCVTAFAGLAVAGAQAARASLTGMAVLPADTFAAGPPSGASKFPSQPVQGFSSLFPASESDWWALVDNGFGTKANSADALLRVYRLSLAMSGSPEGQGSVTVAPGFLTLSDPAGHAPFTIARDGTPERWLTGADFDPESLVRMPDGSFWIGEEFGPSLLHVDARGQLMAPPVELRGVRSPDHWSAPANATQPRSRGFEGLAFGTSGARLFAALEGPTAGDPPGTTRIVEFDPRRGGFGGLQWRYTFEAPDHALTEFVGLGDLFGRACEGTFLAIERDNGHGAEARVKRVYAVTLDAPAENAPRDTPIAARKRLVADLMAVENPARVGGFPLTFTFPFITTESVWPIDRSTLLLVNDNNFPAGGARSGYERDPSEFIRLRLGSQLSCS